MPRKAADPVGTAKQDPKTKAVAVRCKSGMPGEWAVMTVDNGGHYAPADEVADWPKVVPEKVDTEAEAEK